MIHETVIQSRLPDQVARILIFRIGELGDTLISLPALRAIKASFPDAHIALLSNADHDGRHVLANQVLPERLINEWLSYSVNAPGKLANSLRLVRLLRQRRFDLLVYLGPRLRSSEKVRRDLLFFRLAGIPNVIGHLGFSPLPPPSPEGLPTVMHETDHLLQRLSLSGVLVPAAGAADFELELTEAEHAAAAHWLAEHLPGNSSDRLVGFGPGSKWPSKIWPEERFVEVGRRLIAEEAFPMVFGGREDRELGDRLVRAWGAGANAAGILSVRQAAATLSRCRMYVGNDTGTMHLAAAVRIPCVAIMSALDWPGHWNPYGSGHTVLRRRVPCEGCLLSVCTIEKMRCIKEIEAEEVVNACLQTLKRNPHKSEEVKSNEIMTQSALVPAEL